MSSVTTGQPISVFVSYARKDRVCANLVVDALHALKHTTFLDTRDIERSADFTVQLERQIMTADCMIVCVTPDVARQNSFVRREIAFALGEDERRRARNPAESLRIVPVIFPGGVLPIQISTWTALPVPDDPTVDTLAKLLEEFFQQPSVLPPRDTTSPKLQDYLHDFLADVVDMLGRSVDGLLDLESSGRADLTKVDHIPSARGFRVSPALGSLLGASSNKQNQSSTQVFPTIQTACDHFAGRLLIVGAPGAGKTTTLLALAREAAADRLSDPSCPVPVLAQLNKWKPGSNVVEWATGSNAVLRGQPLLLLLDGLDEMSSAEANGSIDERKSFLEALARDYPDGAVIVTCRVEDFEKLEVQAPLNGAVELSELSRKQVAAYLSGQSARLSDDLFALAQRPLLLALLRASLIETGSNDFSKIHSEADIFDNFVAGRFRHESARGETLPFSEKQTREILGRVAARDVIERERILAIDVEDIAEVFKGDAQSFMNFCLRMHLLSGDKTYPRFMHLRMRDYLATPEVLRAFDAGEKWKPPWTPRNEYFEKSTGFDVEWAIQEIAGFAVEGLVQRTLDAIDADSKSQEFSATTHGPVLNCFNALARVGPSAVPALSRIAKARPNSTRLVAETLSRISGADAVNALVKLLGEQHDREIIWDLGWTNCAEAVQPLQDRFTDSHPHKHEIARSLFRLRKFDESGFFDNKANDADADVRLWAAIYVLEKVVDWSSPDATRQQAIDEVKSALRDRRFDDDLFDILPSIKDPETFETVHDVLRRELELARADSESSEVEDRIRLIQVLGAQSNTAFVETFRQATLDQGQLSEMDSVLARNSSVREAAQQALARIDSSVSRSAMAHPDSDGVFALAQSFDGDPAVALKEAAQRILERTPSEPRPVLEKPLDKPEVQSDSIVVRTVLSALACVAITATPLWWPALIVAIVVTFILFRGNYKSTNVVLVAPRAYALDFWISDISKMVGQGRPVLIVTGAEMKFSNPTHWATSVTTALLAIIASVLAAFSGPFNWFWTIAYMVPGSLMLLRFPSTPRHWGTFGFFSAFISGQLIWSLTNMPLWLTLLISVAVFLAVSFVFSMRKLRVRDTLGTVPQLESLAAELDGKLRWWRRWLSPVPANYYVIRCVDWAVSAVTNIITPHTKAIWFDAMTTQPHHIRDLVTVCIQRQIPLMAIVQDHEVKDEVDKLLSLGFPRSNIRVFKGGLDQSSFAELSTQD